MSTSILPNQELHPNEHRPFWSNWRIWAAAVALLFALGISILFGSKQAAQRGYFGQRLFPLKEAFDFNLINQDAQPVQLHELRGKVVLFLFGFTHCPTSGRLRLPILPRFTSNLHRNSVNRSRL